MRTQILLAAPICERNLTTIVNEQIEELANNRTEALVRAKLEAEAAAATSLREEADRLLSEHRDRTTQLLEEMQVRQRLCSALSHQCDHRCQGHANIVRLREPTKTPVGL